MKSPAYALAIALLAMPPARGQPAPKPIVYNNLDGDGSQELDRAIKQAYSAKYTLVDTRRADGYVEPNATAGDLPKDAVDAAGRHLAGYVLAVYIVGQDGLVDDPVVLKTTDGRLSRVALDAMARWRFMPGQLGGAPVATTAAQEFNFGPAAEPGGYHMTRLVVYQDNATLLRRLPPKAQADVYLDRLQTVAHNFFVGDTKPETFHIVVMLRPGGRSRIWFVSSIRPGNGPELEPLRKLLEAVAPLTVSGGPALLTLSGTIMGGDGADLPEDLRPMPAEWRDIEKGLDEPLPVSSDAFMDLAWPDAK